MMYEGARYKVSTGKKRGSSAYTWAVLMYIQITSIVLNENNRSELNKLDHILQTWGKKNQQDHPAILY